jgi:hypothetical protein
MENLPAGEEKAGDKSNSDEDVTKSVSAASIEKVATGGDPGGHD